MSIDPATAIVENWRTELPALAGPAAVLREPAPRDVRRILDLLSAKDATLFGLDEPLSEGAVRRHIERFAHDRSAGVAFTYAIKMSVSRAVVGLIQVRQLTPDFGGAEWECTIAPAARGTGLFLEAARLVGSFCFGSIGTHRLEARVLLRNGRANGALRKLGAVQEGILRGSIDAGGDADRVLWSLLKEDWGHSWVSSHARVH